MNNDKTLEVTLAGLATAKPLQKWTVYSWGAWETQRIPDAWAAIDGSRSKRRQKSASKDRNGCWTVRRSNRIRCSARTYDGRPGWRGRSNFTDEQLREILQLALARPTQLALHVVGDAETDRVLKMMEQLAPAATWRPSGYESNMATASGMTRSKGRRDWAWW